MFSQMVRNLFLKAHSVLPVADMRNKNLELQWGKGDIFGTASAKAVFGFL